ncbi:hypothetical protein PMIN02_006078 [Paraphaeosphaeria minitans]
MAPSDWCNVGDGARMRLPRTHQNNLNSEVLIRFGTLLRICTTPSLALQTLPVAHQNNLFNVKHHVDLHNKN